LGTERGRGFFELGTARSFVTLTQSGINRFTLGIDSWALIVIQHQTHTSTVRIINLRIRKMTPTRVLILGGHGKVSLLLTRLLVQEPGWHISSVVRSPSQREEILELGKGQKGEVDVVVESLEDIQSSDQAKQVLNKVDPNYVVFSAGKHGTFAAILLSRISNDTCSRRWWKRWRITDIRH
jgi:NADPH:quinone reductase-like Zn-dependent oxidoreductase